MPFPPTPEKILVRMPNWLGDFVMATPVLSDLRRHFPRAEITAMCKFPLNELLIQDPDVDEVFAFRKPSCWFRRDDLRDIMEKIRQGKYDTGVLLTNSFSSAWWFYGGKIARRIGYRGHWRKWLLTDALKRPGHHQVEDYKHLLTPLGIPISSTSPRLHMTPQEIEEAKMRLALWGVDEKSIVIGVNPGAAYGSAKCWPKENFRELTRRLAEIPRSNTLFFGDQSTAPLIRYICDKMPPNVINLATYTSLRELVSLIHRCQLFITNDSGPMHIADALKVPLIALFGSTDPQKTGPSNGGTVVYKAVECSPCFKRTCPIDFRCMKSIEVEDVFALVKKRLFPLNPLTVL